MTVERDCQKLRNKRKQNWISEQTVEITEKRKIEKSHRRARQRISRVVRRDKKYYYYYNICKDIEVEKDCKNKKRTKKVVPIRNWYAKRCQ